MRANPPAIATERAAEGWFDLIFLSQGMPGGCYPAFTWERVDDNDRSGTRTSRRQPWRSAT
ncbi:MAG: hypothetical protein ACXWNI_03655 [Candidatus Limnocylindrales bacterium]